VWRSRAQRPPAPSDDDNATWSDQPTDPWTGPQPSTVPGWGEDATPRSRHSRPDPGAGRHGAPDEPTWAGSSGGIDPRPDTARWADTGEQTWGGQHAGAPAQPRHESADRPPEEYDRAPAYQPRPGYDEPTRYEQPRRYEEPAARPHPHEPAARPYPHEPADRPGHPTRHDEPEDPWLHLEEEQPRPGGPGGRVPDEPTAFRRRKGGPVAKIVGISVVVVLCLALVGGGAYFLWGRDKLGGSGEAYFPNLTVTELMAKVKGQGFQCYPGSKIAQCDKQIKGADLGITVHFTGEDQVTKLEASGGTAAYTNDAAKPEDLRSFFEWAAQLPFGGRGDAAAAKTWGSEHVGKSGEQTVGGVRYQSAGDQPLLTMTPA
jgi:hypothetical protein